LLCEYYHTDNDFLDKDGDTVKMSDLDLFAFYANRSYHGNTRPTPVLFFDNSLFTSMLTTYWYVREEKFDEFLNYETRTTNDDTFDIAFDLLHPKKSPGSPLCFLHVANEQLKVMKDSIKNVVDYRIFSLIDLGEKLYEMLCSEPDEAKRFFGLTMDLEFSSLIAVDLVSRNLCDPVLLRHKTECRPLGKKKRLICCVSAQDTLVDRFALHNFLKHEQEHKDIPTATGLDLNTPEKTQELYEEFLSHAPLASSDIQGWEYSTTPELQLNEAIRCSYVMGLCNSSGVVYEGKENHFYLVLARTYCLIHRVLQTQSGDLFTSSPGLTTSGALPTYSRNSGIRTEVAVRAHILSKYACSPSQVVYYSPAPPIYIKAGGDDMLTNSMASPEATARLGFTVTDYAVQENAFNFCSTRFENGVSYQENIRKFVCHVLYDKSHWLEKMQAFESGFRHHPEYDMYAKVFSQETPLCYSSTDAPQSLTLGNWDDEL